MRLSKKYIFKNQLVLVFIYLLFLSKLNFTSLYNKNKKNISSSKNKLAKTSTKTIVEYQQSSEIPISYYYPFFYKIGVLIFQDMKLDYGNLSMNCDDINCHYCERPPSKNCLKCYNGFFLTEVGCQIVCPKGFIADILRQKCIKTEQSNSDNIYTMAYSIGSCVNKCKETNVQDCSCNPTCKSNGSCCFDYVSNGCDLLLNKSSELQDECKNVDNCNLCDNSKIVDDKPQCDQCVKNFYLYQGKCYKKCPQNTVEDNQNYLCKEMDSCSIPNCYKCILASYKECKQCSRGYFLFEEKCVEKCPVGYRADRISWSCLEYPVFSWYYVLPSISCRNNCFTKTNTCSCNPECFQKGNCCQDIDEYCVDFVVFRKKEEKI